MALGILRKSDSFDPQISFGLGITKYQDGVKSGPFQSYSLLILYFFKRNTL